MYPQEPNFWQRNRVTLKAISVGILILVLLIPTAFIQGLIMERKDRQAEVAAEVSYPMQYVLVGLALCIFYTLLLSVSEYVDFNISYSIAATATVLLVSFYTKSLFSKWSIALLFGIFLGLLYGFIFILIQLQDGALLFGSIGLFVLLAVVMYYSRRLDWNYALVKLPVSKNF